MKFTLLTIVFILFAQVYTHAQNRISGTAGFGTHGFFLRGDVRMLELETGEPEIESNGRLYLEFMLKNHSFDNQFNFSNILYSSDVRVFRIGIGAEVQFLYQEKFVLTPYIGLLYSYARFKDADLFEAIGDNGIQRLQNGFPHGPVVENGYGNNLTVDVGARLGYRIIPNLEIGGTLGFAYVRFNSERTLFGKWRYQKPYENAFFIKQFPIRMDVHLKINI